MIEEIKVAVAAALAVLLNMMSCNPPPNEDAILKDARQVFQRELDWHECFPQQQTFMRCKCKVAQIRLARTRRDPNTGVFQAIVQVDRVVEKGSCWNQLYWSKAPDQPPWSVGFDLNYRQWDDGQWRREVW